MSDEDWYASNRAWWDARAPVHAASEFYGLEAFVADPGATTLRPFEVEEVGDVAGQALVHPQCHFGMDTLSWARRGAEVVGIDLSPAAVDAATGAADRAGLDARFVVGNVYDAVEAVEGRRFDVVYTGLGALNWLPDLPRWAAIVAELLEPGGFLYLSEFHPFTWVFADETLEVEYGYFHDPTGESFDEGEQGSYADLNAPTRNNATREWAHSLSDVIGAVIGAGLRLELLHEHDYTLFPRFKHLELDTEFLTAGVVYRQPEGTRRLPLMYSLRARRS